MAMRCSSPSLTRLLLLLAVLGGEAAMARSLLGIAEPPSPAAAAGPAGEGRPGGGERRPDRSIAGADVILVGFAAAVMVVIFCYIRITRKSNSRAVVGLGESQKA